MNASDGLIPNVDYGQWTFVIAFETLLLVSTAYLLCALFWYWRKTICSSAQNHHTSSGKLKSILLALFTAYATLGFAKFSLAQIIFYAPVPANVQKCVGIGKAYQIIHTIGTTCLYSFLWLRQNTLYREPSLSRLATKLLISFSRGLLVVITVAGLAGVIGVLLSTSGADFGTLNGTNACYYLEKTGSNAIIVYIGYAVVIIIQGSLLFLFIHILRRHRQELSFHKNGSDSSSALKIRRLVRNCSVAAAISASIDLTVVLIDPFIKGYIIQLVTNWIWDCDYAVNLLCTLFCFANWKQILFPWTFSNSDNDGTSATAGTSST